LFVKAAPSKTADAIKQIQLSYKKYETETPVEFNFVNEALNESYRDDKRTARIILLFAGLTVFVGCLGLFGLAVFKAEQRIKEIGIRKVLGAGVASIAALLSKDFLRLVIIATIIAVPPAWYVSNRWLQGYAYRINMDWWVFALVAAGVLIIAFLTTGVQSVKAARSNPIKSLRTE
jgi:ABC-type antimicrobial peptide transport system permease subunit